MNNVIKKTTIEQTELNSAVTNETTTKQTEPKKEVILNENITYNMERIQKNIDFCNNAGNPDALKAGGKYFKSFSKLVTDTVAMELEELKKRLTQYFPYLPNTKEGKRLTKVIDETIENSNKYFEELTRNANNKELIIEFDNVTQEYSNKYVDIILSRYDII